MLKNDANSLSRRGFLTSLAAAPFGASALLSSTTTAAQSRPAKQTYRGIFTIAATPFTETKALDFEDLAIHVDWLNRCGAHGIVWPQYASEFEQISKEERIEGFKVICEAAHKYKVQSAIVLGIQGDTTDEALDYLEHAVKYSPNALIAMPPVKAKNLDDYRDYYFALARATDRPIFIQTSGGAKIDLPTNFLVELARSFPNLGYIKDEKRPVFVRTRELCRQKPPLQRVFSGMAGKGMMVEMALGSDGTMPGAPLTDVYVQIWNAWQSGAREKARDIFAELMPLLNLRSIDGQGYQYMLHHRGIFKTPVSRKERGATVPEAKTERDALLRRLKPYLVS